MAIIDQETLDFLIEVAKITSEAETLAEMLDDPVGFAQEHYIPITTNVVDRLYLVKQERNSHYFTPDDPINIEMMSFFNKVVIDGRYIKEWFDEPEYVAHELGLYISPLVIQRIEQIDFDNIIEIPNVAIAPIVIAILIHIVIEIATIPPAYMRLAIAPIIVDRSAMDKI